MLVETSTPIVFIRPACLLRGTSHNSKGMTMMKAWIKRGGHLQLDTVLVPTAGSPTSFWFHVRLT